MSTEELLNTLSQLVSEQRNPDTLNLDSLTTLELVSKINRQDQQVPAAVASVLPDVAKAVDAISQAFTEDGRLLYIGAGTSGRLGILDASECPPTFGVPESMVVGVIAGGREAVYKSFEGAEDSADQGKQDLITQAVNSNDVVVGIAASGRTPYVVGALEYANSIGAKTVAVSCNPHAGIANCADIAISPVVGPEVLTGSTRMKSGTAQKLVLNMLTTASMIKIGKSYQNLMVDVQASNEKLVARAIRIVMQATQCSKEEAESVLQQSGFSVKTAILMKLTKMSEPDATRCLTDSSGFLHRAIEQSNSA